MLDEVTKRLAVHYLGNGEFHSYWGDTFRLELSENNGAFLSLGSNLPPALRFWLLTVGLGLSLFCLFAYIFRSQALSSRSIAGLTLICTGGLSNWLDRLLFGGYVIDFMNVGIGSLRSGIFNVADLLIEAGAILVLLDMYRTRERRPA
jgi:signal peptidase II